MANKKTRARKKPVSPVVASQPPIPGNFFYGRDWGEMNQLQIELVRFLSGLSVADGGLWKAEHFWNVVAMLWPATSRKPFFRNPWGERMVEECCNYNFSSVSGCSSSSKTDTAAVWGIVNWLAVPLDTKVLCTSTTLRESRKRIWGSIEDYWNALLDGARMIGQLASSFGWILLSQTVGERGLESAKRSTAIQSSALRFVALHDQSIKLRSLYFESLVPKLLSKITVGNTIVRFNAPSESNCAPQLSLHPKSLVPVKHREFLSPNVEVFGLVAMRHPMRWCSSSALRIFIADPFPKDARCGQLTRRLFSNSLARKFTRKMATPAWSPCSSILRPCSARISPLGGMCLVSLSAVWLGGVEVSRSRCLHGL